MQARESSAMGLNTILFIVLGISIVAVVCENLQYQMFCVLQPYI